MEFFLIALIGLFSGTIKGSSGFGSSLVALPLLVLFYSIEEVVVIMITLNVILNLIMLFENKKFSIKHLKDVKVIVVFGVIFTFVGLLLLDQIDEQIIKYFAALLIFIAVLNRSTILKFKVKDSVFFQAVSGAISGFSNGIASIDGPPIVFYLTSIDADKARFKNTLVSYFFVLGSISVVFLGINGKYSTDILKDTIYIGVFLVLGVLFGIILSSKVNESQFQKYIMILLIILGISMFL